MPWLLRDDQVLATLEVADSLGTRARGLIGREGIEGALLLRPAWSVHTFGVRFPIDVAHCDGDMRVLRTTTMSPNRLGLPVLQARAVIESEAGTFREWGLRPGDELEVKA